MVSSDDNLAIKMVEYSSKLLVMIARSESGDDIDRIADFELGADIMLQDLAIVAR